jgi:hypothetical protein
MRRLWLALLAVACLGTIMGCHHVAGVCDCGDGCYGYGLVAPAAPAPGPGDPPPADGGGTMEKAK